MAEFSIIIFETHFNSVIIVTEIAAELNKTNLNKLETPRIERQKIKNGQNDSSASHLKFRRKHDIV